VFNELFITVLQRKIEIRRPDWAKGLGKAYLPISEKIASVPLDVVKVAEDTDRSLYLADVFLPDGTNLNHTLVKDGWCWWYRKYALGDTVLEGLEKEAREARKGVWADPQPVPPWEWRKRK
jgi:endonuclease YncB( thermonuclease family)